jgi:phage virion morphogenesis protein
MLNTRLTLVSDTISVALKDLSAHLEDPHQAMKDIGAEMQKRISARFESQSDPSGKAWAPRSQVTLDLYAKRAEEGGPKGHGRILDDIGTMLSSLVWEADQTSVVVGFGAVASKKGDAYAVYHEFGAPKNNMPRRGLIFEDPESSTLTQDDKQAISDIIIASMFG